MPPRPQAARGRRLQSGSSSESGLGGVYERVEVATIEAEFAREPDGAKLAAGDQPVHCPATPEPQVGRGLVRGEQAWFYPRRSASSGIRDFVRLLGYAHAHSIGRQNGGRAEGVGSALRRL